VHSVDVLDDLFKPIGKSRFVSEYYRRKALHLPGSAMQPNLFSFEKLNDILALTPVWNENNLRIWYDCRLVPMERYSSPLLTGEGYRLCPDIQKIERWFDKGASLTLNQVDDLTPELRSVANYLEAEFRGYVSANIYASCAGRRAFDSHYDDHEVFCFHVEGTKKWRLYEGWQDNPVGQPSYRPNLQQLHNEAKGPVEAEVIMTPGDFLYIPRGQYHDALAKDSASLHVTFSLTPMNGLGLFDLLQAFAVTDSLFRDDLPNSDSAAGKIALTNRLALLGDRMQDILNHPSLTDKIIEAQGKHKRTRREGRIGIRAYPPSASRNSLSAKKRANPMCSP